MSGYLLLGRPETTLRNKDTGLQGKIISLIYMVALKRAFLVFVCLVTAYLELVYLVTALVPSETACLASSPGSRSLTAVWISREVMVDLLL